MKLMGRYLAMALLMAGAVGTGAGADDSRSPVVIELFTSQGCPGCPPADALLKRLRERDDTLTLSWPVDYWDRLGWEDTFASPENSKRQAAYNKRLGVAGVFTPELVVDGTLWCKGAEKAEVLDHIAERWPVKKLPFAPTLTQQGTVINAHLPATKIKTPVAIRVVWYLADAEVKIDGGENEGRTLHYTNVVRKSMIIGDWDGSATVLKLDASDAESFGADHVAILLQARVGDADTGEIYGAATIRLQ